VPDPARRPGIVSRLRAELDWVFVDEYQDTDPAQVRLLQAVAGGGRDLVVVGDPDQSIYTFRGAEARGILDFPDRFRTVDGAPAPVRALATTRRFGPVLLAASRNLARRLGVPRALPADVFAGFREPRSGWRRSSGLDRGLHLCQPGRGGRAHRRDPAQRAPA
jgi:superfamily I DNA/RNA helicase